MQYANLVFAGIAALFLGPTPPIAQPAVGYPCDTITENMVERFSGFGQPVVAPSVSVLLKQGVEIAAADTALIYKKYRIENPALRQKKPVIFREYRINGAQRMCTVTLNNRIFGKRDTKKRFHLRCLIDADADGQYEAAIPVGKYVRHNPVTGLIVTRRQGPAIAVTLPEPVKLVEEPGVAVRKAKHISYINTRISAGEVDGEIAEIIINSAINVLPDEEGYGLVADRKIVLARLFDGNEFTAEGAKIRIEQSVKGWTARLLKYAGPPAKLQCDGMVVTLPRSYTIVTAERQSVVRR